MPFFLIALIALIVIYGPALWTKRIIGKYNKTEYFSGTGETLAKMIVENQSLPNVSVQVSGQPDHFDPHTKTVSLNRNTTRRSLSSVVIAAHEVGHAIQDASGYKPLQLRTRYALGALKIERVGAFLMMLFPMLTAFTRVPAVGAVLFLTALITLSIPIFLHLLTLPMEFDASFNRALPLLKQGKYIPESDYKAARQILLACALTYVAAALADLLNILRWIRVLRR